MRKPDCHWFVARWVGGLSWPKVYDLQANSTRCLIVFGRGGEVRGGLRGRGEGGEGVERGRAVFQSGFYLIVISIIAVNASIQCGSLIVFDRLVAGLVA